MKPDTKRSRAKTKGAAQTAELSASDVSLMVLDLDFHTPPGAPQQEWLIDYPLRQFVASLKRFSASLEPLMDKLACVPLYDEMQQHLLEKVALCEQLQYENLQLKEQLRAMVESQHYADLPLETYQDDMPAAMDAYEEAEERVVFGT
jgi:hypothetical protein